MIEKICLFLTEKIRKEMPEIDDERAEVINYGVQLIVGEIPKTIILFICAYFLGVFKQTVFMILALLPYRAFSGGFHLKTHLGCIVSTNLYYCGVALISKNIILYNPIKGILALCIWIFSMIMVTLYAPADTENVPILRKEERKRKKIFSYVVLSIGLIVAVVVQSNELSNILLFGTLCQSFMISRIAYKITNNKYGHEVYAENAT